MEDITIFLNYGLGAFIAVYLVYWVTKSLNGKLDKLKESLDSLKESIDRLRAVIEVRLDDRD